LCNELLSRHVYMCPRLFRRNGSGGASRHEVITNEVRNPTQRLERFNTTNGSPKGEGMDA
jgi:hypothetical protein